MVLPNNQRYIIFALGALIGTMILLISRQGKHASIQAQLQEDITKGYITDNRYYPGQELYAQKPIHIDPEIQFHDLPINPSNNQFHRYLLTPARFSSHKKDLIKEQLWKDPNDGFERLIRRQYMDPHRLLVRTRPNTPLPSLSNAIQNLGYSLGKQKSTRAHYVLIPEPITADSLHNAIQTLQSSRYIELAFPAYVDPNPKH